MDCAARRLAAHLAMSCLQSSCELFTAAAADDDEYSSDSERTSCSAPPREPPRGPAAAATRRAPSPHAPSRARPSSSRGQHGSRWWSRGRRATLGSSTGPGGVVRLAAPDALGPCWMIVCGARALGIEQSLRVTWAGPVWGVIGSGRSRGGALICKWRFGLSWRSEAQALGRTHHMT